VNERAAPPAAAGADQVVAAAPLQVDVDARGVATVRLNRPQRNNAYDGALLQALLDGLVALQADPAVRVIVLRGNGAHFQAGADLGWLREVATRDAAQGSDAAGLAASRLTAQAVRALDDSPKPTVALIHGSCIGGGTGVAAACDVVIAERSAVFAISEARWGLAATIIFPQLDAAIGVRQVRRYALSGERFDAVRAQAIGLVHELCEPGGLDAAAAPVIDGLLRSGPQASAISKRSARACAGAIVSDARFEQLVEEHARRRRSAEAAEGLAAFAQRRPPAWAPRD
jgi:methylglutaconyl-CoA hydratase